MHKLDIKSHSGIYSVHFDNDLLSGDKISQLGTHFIIDKNVLSLLNIKDKNIIVVDATEETKSYQGIEPIINSLISQKLKRDSILVAIGGGIIQDIVCFIATTFMRGIPWILIPTTVLAQADSCIGSKSSINFGGYKNLLGSFTPPNQIFISNQFLNTLEDKDIKSGIGEIIKLCLIDAQVVSAESINRSNIDAYIQKALLIKKKYIEEDEFDKGIRNILNYGHCIGHGIESATNFAIPHGIAITIGMDAANKFAMLEGLITEDLYKSMHNTLYENYKEFSKIPIDIDLVCNALTKDKKNTGSKINIVLPVDHSIEKYGFESNNKFWDQIKNSITSLPITVRS